MQLGSRSSPVCLQDSPCPDISRVHPESEKDLTLTQDLVYIETDSGQILQNLPTSKEDRQLLTVVKFFFNNVQTGSLIPEPTGPNGSHTNGSRICTHTHVNHPVVTEGVLDPHITMIAPSYLYIRQEQVQALKCLSERPNLCSGMPFGFPMPTITITMDASMGGWGSRSILPGSQVAPFARLWMNPEHQLQSEL